MNDVRRVGRYRGGSHSLHRGDPNTLALDGMRLAHAETWGWINVFTWQRPADCLSRHVVTRQKVRNVIF
jgi:hypothetical protein